MTAPLNWDDLRFFLAVARTGRLTAAASQMATDHTTVSRRLRSLETALNSRLFDRSPRGYSLTEAGSRLVEFAETMESAATRMQDNVAGTDAKLAGVVRIGVPDSFGSFFLGPRIGEFSRRHPMLEIQIITFARFFSFSKRDADIAISVQRPIEGRFVSRRIVNYELGLFASPLYLEDNSPIENAGSLARHRFVGMLPEKVFPEDRTHLPKVFDKIAPIITSSSVTLQLNATLAGAGVCMLPHFIARRYPDLIPVLPDEVSLKRSFWLIAHEDVQHLARIRAVIDFIVDEIRGDLSQF